MRLVSGGEDNTLIVWNLRYYDNFEGPSRIQEIEKDKELIECHSKGIRTLVVLDSVAEIIVSGGDDGRIRFWDINEGTLLREIKLNLEVPVMSLAAIEMKYEGE